MTQTSQTVNTGRLLTTTAWIIMLLVSNLPLILSRELFGVDPAWLFNFRMVVLIISLFISVMYIPLRPLLKYVLLVSVLFLLEYLSSWIGSTAFWQARFQGDGFISSMLSTQLLRLIVAGAMVMILLNVHKHPAKFFFVRGNLAAEAAPIPVLMTKPSRWSKLGWILALCITGGTLVFLVAGSKTGAEQWAQLVPILPMVLLFAAINAFSEEMNYRASLLSVLEEPLGKNQALLLTAAFFGLGHFYGVPYGVLGVIMAGVLGWFLGKSMLETRGFCWAWFIHFLQDAAIFSFMALGSIVAGG